MKKIVRIARRMKHAGLANSASATWSRARKRTALWAVPTVTPEMLLDAIDSRGGSEGDGLDLESEQERHQVALRR